MERGGWERFGHGHGMGWWEEDMSMIGEVEGMGRGVGVRCRWRGVCLI